MEARVAVVFELIASQLAELGASWWNQSAWDALVGVEHVQVVDLGTITYFDFGKSDGEAIVLLTGMGVTKTQWDPEFVSMLAADYRIILIDYPGVGTATIHDWSELTVEHLADSVFQLIERQDLGCPHVLGWAFSGKVAGVLFCQHGERLGKYINLAGRIHNSSGRLLTEEDLENLTDSNPVRVAMRAWPFTPWGVSNAAAVGLRVMSHAQEPRSHEMLVAFARAQRAWQEQGGDVDLARIGNDTLIVAGDEDDVAPLEDMRAAAELLQEAGTRVVFVHYAGASHTVLYQYRPFVIRDIKRFLG